MSGWEQERTENAVGKEIVRRETSQGDRALVSFDSVEFRLIKLC